MTLLGLCPKPSGKTPEVFIGAEYNELLFGESDLKNSSVQTEYGNNRKYHLCRPNTANGIT